MELSRAISHLRVLFTVGWASYAAAALGELMAQVRDALARAEPGGET